MLDASQPDAVQPKTEETDTVMNGMDGTALNQAEPAHEAVRERKTAMMEMMTAERQKYLTAIDELRELGISENVSLPQLVVVGDQSSGKSSLLEGITGYGFPVAGDLCTRFATQIVLKRSPDSNIKISIIAGPSSRDDESKLDNYKDFKPVYDDADFTSSIFEHLMIEASNLMGLPSSYVEATNNPNSKRFSDDLLKIEISGPDHHNLSVVDVPGLFHNPTIYQTLEDKEIIRNMIMEYIRDPRTIILAVLDARNNLANQEVFELARVADPEGIRSVGVITKCDAVPDGDEDTVMKIACNEVERLHHGWFVVRNRSTKEIREGVTIEQRHVKEATFFATQKPWKALPKQRCGVPALRAFLGELLFEHIKREFPSVSAEVHRLCDEARTNLMQMGAPRQNAIEQRQYLSRLATTYQRQVDDSLRGNYGPDWPSKDERKLRMLLRNNDDSFEQDMRRDGHLKMFCTVHDEVDAEFERPDEEDDIGYWIRTQYRDCRGAELPGTVNPALLESLFRQQTSRWEKFSMNYLDRAEKIVLEFNEATVRYFVVEEQCRAAILRRLNVRAMENQEQARIQLSKILKSERGGILQTLNHYFADTLNKIREERVLARLEKLGMSNGYVERNVSIKQILGAAHLSNETQATNDIHDILKAYYQVALKRFLDNVLMSVMERHLIGADSTPRMFTADYVIALRDEELASIAQESFGSIRQREEANRKVEMFSRAVQTIKSL